ADGSELLLRHGREATAEEITTVCGADEAANFRRFCDWLGRRPDTKGVALLRPFRTFDQAIAGFFTDPRLQQLFGFASLYAGLSPFAHGAYFPEGGMHAVPRGLAAAIEKAGGVIQ